MRDGQITLTIIVLLLVVIGVVVDVYLQIQTNHMEIQRMIIHDLVQTFSK